MSRIIAWCVVLAMMCGTVGATRLGWHPKLVVRLRFLYALWAIRDVDFPIENEPPLSFPSESEWRRITARRLADGMEDTKQGVTESAVEAALTAPAPLAMP